MLFASDCVWLSWFELWEKAVASSSISEVRRRRVMTSNVGAIQISLQHQFSHQMVSNVFTTGTLPPISVAPPPAFVATINGAPSTREPIDNPVPVLDENLNILPNDRISKRETSDVGVEIPEIKISYLPILTNDKSDAPTSSDQLFKEDLAAQDLESAEVAQALEYFHLEEGSLDSDSLISENRTLLDRLGAMIFSKETHNVIKSIRRLLAAYGQGFEFSNSSILAGSNRC